MIIVAASNDTINWNPTTEAEIKANQISCILKTIKGEIPFHRYAGISDELIGKPINMIKPVLINNVTEVIHNNVSDVVVNSVTFESGESIGDYNIKVVCKI